MKEERIEITATSLDEARSHMKAKIPQGFSVISETVLSDGIPLTIRESGPTTETARSAAKCRVPSGYRIEREREIQKPNSRTIRVSAWQESEARKQVTSKLPKTSTITTVSLAIPGRKGILGIGKKRNQYDVEVLEHAEVEIICKADAKIAVTIGDEHVLRLGRINDLGGTWHGMFVSRRSGHVLEEPNPGSCTTLSSGDWLWFLFTFRLGTPEGDFTPIIVTDAACFWLTIPTETYMPFREREAGVYSFSDRIIPFFAADGSYQEWKTAFNALGRWFATQDSGWSHQWSRRPSRVKDLMSGRHHNWVSSPAAHDPHSSTRQTAGNGQDLSQTRSPRGTTEFRYAQYSGGDPKERKAHMLRAFHALGVGDRGFEMLMWRLANGVMDGESQDAILDYLHAKVLDSAVSRDRLSGLVEDAIQELHSSPDYLKPAFTNLNRYER